MKRIALGLVLSATVAAQVPAAAAPRIGRIIPIRPGVGAPTTDVDAQQFQVNARPPIPFKPFPVADLRTGQPLSSDTIITLKSGKRIKAGEFFAQLNQLEQQFNRMGYTLRQPGVFKLQALKVDQQQLQAQKAMLRALPPATGGGQTMTPVKAVFTGGVASKIVGVRPGLGVFMPTAANMGKTWNHGFGSRDTLGASFSGEINVNGTDQGVNANAVARASGAILGKEWDLARVTGTMNAPKAGGGTVKVNLYVVGLGDTSFTSISGNVSQRVDVSEKFRFSVGPIPMSARLGIRGSAGVQYGMALKPAGLNVSLKPKVKVDAYGQGGVDVLIAEGGIGAELTLLSNSLELGVDGELISEGAGTALKARCYGAGSLEALSGRLYAYAKVDVWLWEDEWQWDIWNYEGFKKDYTLFNESSTLPFQPQKPVVAAR